MVGIYITEDCPYLNKEQAEKFLKLEGAKVHQALRHINTGDVFELTKAPRTLTDDEKKEFEDLTVLIAAIYRKNREFVASDEFVEQAKKDYYSGDEKKAKDYQEGQLYNADMDFMRMMVDFVYMNCEFADGNNPQLDLTESVKTYSDDKEVLSYILVNCGVDRFAKRKYKDVYHDNYRIARRPYSQVASEVDVTFKKLLEDLELVSKSKPTQFGE